MFVTILLGKLRAYMKYRANLRELSALSDTQLADIGLVRGNIEYVARNAAFQ